MFVVAMITPTAIADIGYRYYIVFTVMGGLIPPSVYLFYPETMNRSLEEVNQILHDAPSIISAVKMSKARPIHDDVLGEIEGKVMAEKIE
jgi:hypothetical protein